LFDYNVTKNALTYFLYVLISEVTPEPTKPTKARGRPKGSTRGTTKQTRGVGRSRVRSQKKAATQDDVTTQPLEGEVEAKKAKIEDQEKDNEEVIFRMP